MCQGERRNDLVCFGGRRISENEGGDGNTPQGQYGGERATQINRATRVSQTQGLRYDKTNHLLMHAVGPNLAAVIGSAAAGMFIAMFHEQVLAFYREALKGYENIKFRDWKNDTYIEDDGNREWHSITISKNDKAGARVAIVKDSWTWIIGTLVLRYIGVFMVLMILFLAMTFSGKIISTLVGKLEAKKAT